MLKKMVIQEIGLDTIIREDLLYLETGNNDN